MKQYTIVAEKHLQKVTVSHQRDWDMRLPIFLLAHRASTHETMSLTPDNLVFGREFHLSCDLLFRAPTDKERPTTDHMVNLVDLLHNIHDYVCQHLKLVTK
jgi:hypothetical protein